MTGRRPWYTRGCGRQTPPSRLSTSSAPKFRQASARNKANKQRFEQKEHNDSTSFEVMQITKKNKAGEWVNLKTTDMAETYLAMRAQKEDEPVAQTPDGEVSPTISSTDDNAIYLEAVNDVNKKRMVGIDTQIARKGKAPASSSECSPDDVQDIQSITNEQTEKHRQRQLLKERWQRQLLEEQVKEDRHLLIFEEKRAEWNRQRLLANERAEENQREIRRMLAVNQDMIHQMMKALGIPLTPSSVSQPPPPAQDPPSSPLH